MFVFSDRLCKVSCNWFTYRSLFGFEMVWNWIVHWVDDVHALGRAAEQGRGRKPDSLLSRVQSRLAKPEGEVSGVGEELPEGEVGYEFQAGCMLWEMHVGCRDDNGNVL